MPWTSCIKNECNPCKNRDDVRTSSRSSCSFLFCFICICTFLRKLLFDVKLLLRIWIKKSKAYVWITVTITINLPHTNRAYDRASYWTLSFRYYRHRETTESVNRVAHDQVIFLICALLIIDKKKRSLLAARQ